MNNQIYSDLNTPSGLAFDYIHLGSFSSFPKDNQVAIGRFILIKYCDTTFSQDERNHIEASGGNNLTAEEEKYYQYYLEDNRISKDRMVYQKLYENNSITYKEMALINSTVSNESINDFKNYLDTIQSQIKNVTTVMDFVGISSTVPTEKGATVSNISNYQKGDVVIDNSGVEYVNIAGGNSPNAWEIIGDATRLASIEEKINNLQVGGRNLVLDSKTKVLSNNYLVHEYKLSEPWEVDQHYTVSLKGTINEGQVFSIWANGQDDFVGNLEYDFNKKIYIGIFSTFNKQFSSENLNTLTVFNYKDLNAIEASIEWIKLEKGNMPTDWTPAPEDCDIKLNQALTWGSF